MNTFFIFWSGSIKRNVHIDKQWLICKLVSQLSEQLFLILKRITNLRFLICTVFQWNNDRCVTLLIFCSCIETYNKYDICSSAYSTFEWDYSKYVTVFFLFFTLYFYFMCFVFENCIWLYRKYKPDYVYTVRKVSTVLIMKITF